MSIPLHLPVLPNNQVDFNRRVASTVNALITGIGELPVADALTPGAVYPITAGLTINASEPNKVFHLYNNSGSSVTLTQGSGMTLRLAGTATTGNRTLLPRGEARLWYFSATVVLVSGNVT